MLRRFWPPPADFAVVLVLSVILGAWPAFDPTFAHRLWYVWIVAALMVAACFFSAQSRAELEKRYEVQRGLQLSRLQSRAWEMMREFSGLAVKHRLAGKTTVSELPLLGADPADLTVRVVAFIGELAEIDVFITRELQATLNKGLETPEDLMVVAAGLKALAEEVGARNTRRLS